MKRLAASFVSIDETDEQCRATDTRMQLLEDLKGFGNKARFKNQILRWVPCYREFRGQDEFGATGRQTLVRLEGLLKIASQISDNGIELGEADFHSALRRLCATPRAAIPFSRLALYGPITARCL